MPPLRLGLQLRHSCGVQRNAARTLVYIELSSHTYILGLLCGHERVAALFPGHSFEVAAMSPVNSTTNHDEIRRWVASRKGHPAFVKSTRKGDSGLLRVDFREPEEGFEEIS